MQTRHEAAQHDRLTIAEATRVGEELREARLALGVSLRHGGAAPHPPRLPRRAGGRAARDLPGLAYALGFVRNYANALGLDTDELLRRFREVSTARGPRRPGIPGAGAEPRRARRRGDDRRRGAGARRLCRLVQLVGGGDRVVDTVPPLPPRLEQAAESVAPRNPDRLATVTPPAAPLPGIRPAPRLPRRRAGCPGARPGDPRPPRRPRPPVPPRCRWRSRPWPPPRRRRAGRAAGGAAITLRAKTDAWIQVRDPRGAGCSTASARRRKHGLPEREGWCCPPARPKGWRSWSTGTRPRRWPAPPACAATCRWTPTVSAPARCRQRRPARAQATPAPDAATQ